MNKETTNVLLINTIWSLFGRFGYLIIGLITNIILVRLLGPEDFGQVAIIMFFITFSIILTESGLSGALVRKNNVTEIDISTIFLFNLIVSSILMVILICTSGYIANFYNNPELKSLLIFSSLILVINALGNIQMTLLIKEMKFKRKSLYEVIATICGSIFAIFLALNNYGALSIVSMQMVNAIVLTGLLWFFVGPLKTYKFSLKSFKGFYKFGVNTTLSSLLNASFNNIYQLILAKYFLISKAGYFYQAKQLHDIPVNLLQSSILGVIYSALCKVQDEPENFNKIYNKILKVYTITISLICTLIFIYADLIIYLLYGKEWLQTSTYLKMLILSAFFYAMEIFYRNIFKVFDKTDKILKIEIIKKIFQSTTIIYGIYKMDIYILILGFVITSVFGFLISLYMSEKVKSSISKSFVKDFIFIILINLLLGCIFYFNFNDYLKLFFSPIFIIVYFYLLRVFRVFNIFEYLRFSKKINF